jgi:hypothetical protein
VLTIGCALFKILKPKKKKGENGWGKDENNLLLEKAMR